ncbi:unique cartilage matrix-associated protein [Clupea harengus]|uniref:Unique cartilage matrix-associated protein n=1 Tax=Clupea harengus TaxID=7950 RepID=A0A6P8FB10_CLUHA|nr:unique cartilage matrix-associated protein [Clupea harengus]XP_031420949.1 unique cartilage matrix-associated protein [Clupea harengus]XP_042563291.1 unique cartilage matrix-associated protein [Clupea harengus]XP_042563292.1 unique cartilage matrix-associated protein [Clupea harengus]
MSWTHPALLALLAILIALTLSNEADSASVSDDKPDSKAASPQGAMKKIFMPEADAFNFFRRRTRRGVKSQDELDVEQRQVLAADERKREYHENQRSKFENYAEEEGDEQDERSREGGEQWREFSYDGQDQ